MIVNSFDVFDTLIARRCVEPTVIFDIVAERSGLSDFKSIRMSSEQSVIHTNYTYDDIYVEFQKVTDINEQTIDMLKKLEKEVELENCIPIAENIKKVRNGDLLISDMYHSKDFILSMLKKCGLTKEVTLIVTSGGKHTGRIWNQLSPYFKIKTHHGDNLHSDVRSPLSNNIHSQHTDTHKLSQTENEIHNAGLYELSKLIRELRLVTLDINQDHSSYMKNELQLSFNIPILLLTAVYLKFLSTKLQSTNILFSSRDCYYLHKIYKHLFKSIDDSSFTEYFYTSRHSRMSGSEDYRNYTLSKMNNKSLVVDLCGTGISLNELYQKCNVYPDTFFIHKLAANQIQGYRPTLEGNEKKQILSFVDSVPFDNGLLEMLNYVDHGMVLDVVDVKELNTFHPIFEEPDYPVYVINYISSISKTMNQVIELINCYPLHKLIGESFQNIEKVPNLIYSLYSKVNKNQLEFRDIQLYHKKQDGQTLTHF